MTPSHYSCSPDVTGIQHGAWVAGDDIINVAEAPAAPGHLILSRMVSGFGMVLVAYRVEYDIGTQSKFCGALPGRYASPRGPALLVTKDHNGPRGLRRRPIMKWFSYPLTDPANSDITSSRRRHSTPSPDGYSAGRAADQNQSDQHRTAIASRLVAHWAASMIYCWAIP
jgi:hypothetical protein